jgi:hypothetical protein
MHAPASDCFYIHTTQNQRRQLLELQNTFPPMMIISFSARKQFLHEKPYTQRLLLI